MGHASHIHKSLQITLLFFLYHILFLSLNRMQKVINVFSAMLHSGLGHRQITSFMAAIEIEGLHHKSMKRREKEVEPHVLSVAKESCSDALANEVNQQETATR